MSAASTAAGDGDVVLYESRLTRVVRTVEAGVPAIRKEARGPTASRRLRHEATILHRLRGITGVVHLLADPSDTDTDTGAILLADTGGRTLTEAVADGRPAVAEVVELAVRLAGTLEQVHRHGVVHKDISPANVLVHRPGPRPMLIDFQLATTFTEDRPAFTAISEVTGTLAYLAPEQTGRTGRTVDQRSDLYALGATLYELACGAPPFGTGDPLRLIHDHLARVPVAPVELDDRIPRSLSDILLRLLEKDPDRRYQSAEGLVYDLTVLRGRLARGRPGPFPLGERDFPVRLAPPSRPVGREPELAALAAAFRAAAAGNGGGLLVAGRPGVGKTTLINELRPIVTAAGGWMITGKFDQYRHDPGSDAVWQALRGLGRLLLAQPADSPAAQALRLRAALGANAGLAAGLLPEFAVLLGTDPETISGDLAAVEHRLRRTCLDLLRATASAACPLAVVIDDLQWAGPRGLRLVDALQTADDLPHVLLVGAYREDDVGPAHPLTGLRTRWQRIGRAPTLLRLRNLPAGDVTTLLAQMLRLPAGRAAELAAAIGPHSDGNPYDTVELVNALRREGALVARSGSWQWDAGQLRRHVGLGDVVGLLTTRIGALPRASRDLLAAMACLGEVELAVLETATGLDAAALERRLAPPLEDGLLALDQGAVPAVRFRHDRVREAATALPGAGDGRLRLALARRLARVPRLAAVAAEQYLPVADAVTSRAERLRVAGLFRTAAAGVRLVNPAGAERFLAGAARLVPDGPGAGAGRALLELRIERHSVLYDLGRHDEVDALYTSIEADPALRTATGVRRHARLLAQATAVQVNSLCDRGRQADGVTLGLAVLGRFGLDTAPAQIATQTGQQWADLRRWTGELDVAAAIEQPEITDPEVLAIAQLLARLVTTAFFHSPNVLAWLVFQGQRVVARHGFCENLGSAMSMGAPVILAMLRDRALAYQLGRKCLQISAGRGYLRGAAANRAVFALFTAHWFEPLENIVTLAEQGREGLLQSGVLQTACYTHHTSLGSRLDCAPVLDDLDEEVESAQALAAATANTHVMASMQAYRQLLRALRGQTTRTGGFDDENFDERAYLADAHAVAESIYRVNRAVAAAVFGDWATLAEQVAATLPLMLRQGGYRTALAQVLQALALGHRLRTAPAADRPALLAQIDACRTWLAGPAADAPDNYLHLLRLIEAERAWAGGDLAAAITAFDAAIREAEPRRRPWHRALIMERAATCHLEHGLEHLGRLLLAQARDRYRAWGATAKVDQLHRDHPFLRDAPDLLDGPDRPGRGERATADRHGTAHGRLTTESLDLMAVLDAARTLSSETGISRLSTRVGEILSALTGATAVRVLLYDETTGTWQFPSDVDDIGDGAGDGEPVRGDRGDRGDDHPDRDPPAGEADAGWPRSLPWSAVRYVERTAEPLLVDDATRDYRFSMDPYFTGLPQCSLVVLPILAHGTTTGMLVLENRLTTAGFSTGRLDAARLIAGQLAVSLRNASLYASLERKVAERTRALELANGKLATLAVTDALTGLANRRKLHEVLDEQLRAHARNGASIGLMMIDVDHFKQYNDHYGHPAGDACLRSVAAVLHAGGRETDLIARYGGEEFTILLVGTDPAGALAAAERARAAVAALRHPHATTAAGVVTVSIGLTVRTPATEPITADELFTSADKHLYLAKHLGRNRVQDDPPAHRAAG